MKLSTRLTIVMAAVVVVTATALGAIIYHAISAVSVPRVLERLSLHTRLLGLDLESSRRDVRPMVLAVVAAVRLDGLIGARVGGRIDPAEGRADAALRAYVAERYQAIIRPRPEYLQIRLIGVNDGGRELVRVERHEPNAEIRVVPDDELQRRAEGDYFRKAIELPAGELYVSPIDLSRQSPETTAARIPLLRVATPMKFPDGSPLGIMTVSVDMRQIFARIRSAALRGAQVFAVNEQGDYLVHPDPAKEFGFAFGKPARLQDDFPDFAQILSTDDVASRVMEDRSGERFGVAWNTVTIVGGPRVTIVEVLPNSLVMAAANSARNVAFIGGIAAILGAGLLAVILARSLTKPLVQLTNAVSAFGSDESISVPTGATGEIGILARAFANMATRVRDNTAALRSEIADRQAAQENFRLAIEGAPSGHIMTDSNGIIVLVNAEVERLFGYTRGELTGSTIEILMPADIRTAHRRLRDEFAADPRARRMGTGRDLFGVRKDGTSFPIEIGLNPISTASGVFILAQVIDIGDRKRSEAELQRYSDRERLFIAAIESSDDAIITKALDGTITGWNSGAERLFGYTAAEMVGQPIDVIVPLELRTEVHAILDKIARGEKVQHHETVRVSKDGRRIDVSLSISPVKSISGAIIGAAKVARDVTGRNRTREALRESEQMARGIIDTALDAFIQFDATGVLIDWSPKAEAMFGWTRQEVVGSKIEDILVRPEHRVAYSERIAHYVKDAAGGTIERRFEAPSLRRDGSMIDTEISLTVVRRGDGFVVNSFLRDVTEKNMREEQLRQSQKMEAVGQLTGGIAHDFNNMLTVITGTIDILANLVADKPQAAALTKLISEATDRGAELTGQLLAFARKQPLQPKDTDVNALIIDTVKLLRPTIGERIEVEHESQPDSWRALIDQSQLSAAILNLCVNARDAMPDGGTLTLKTQNVVVGGHNAGAIKDVTAGDYLVISVSDTGSGIPEDLREKIFEPFFSTKEVGKGTGLGLSMVYGFIKQSGGHIAIDSKVGQGTTFKIYLPRVTTLTTPQSGETPAPRLELGHETILVVEDEPAVRKVATAQIESLGYKALLACNAAEALAMVDRGDQFDLLFTDVMMPGALNGRQLAEEISRRRPSLHVLFTSGYSDEAMIEDGHLIPGALLISKPYRRPELARMIRVALDTVPQVRHDPELRKTGTD